MAPLGTDRGRQHRAARGRASRIEKPFSEITIVVRELGEAA